MKVLKIPKGYPNKVLVFWVVWKKFTKKGKNRLLKATRKYAYFKISTWWFMGFDKKMIEDPSKMDKMEKEMKIFMKKNTSTMLEHVYGDLALQAF